MIKSLCLVILLLVAAQTQTVTHYTLLPVQTTQNVLTTYSLLFGTDTRISSNAQVAVTFPFEFLPRDLNKASRVRYAIGNGALQNSTWSIKGRTYLVQINPSIPIGNITIVIDGIRNPQDYDTSSEFIVETLFKNVVITQNSQYGRVPFTKPPTVTPGGTASNQANPYIEQGATWKFTFTPSRTYPAEYSLRFIFPEGFKSNQVQCNVSGVVDPNMLTRVLPGQNVYDCLNLKQPLTGGIRVLLSGLVNPNAQTTVSGIEIHILQPNNKIVRQIVQISNSVLVRQKPLNATVQIPNQYRNTSTEYTFIINFDTDLNYGDYVVFEWTGLWNIFTNATRLGWGVLSKSLTRPLWASQVDTTASKSTLTLSNFTKLYKSEQFTFFQPLVTPLAAATYSLSIKAYRENGGLAQQFTQNVVINKTTGYIREMKLHPMQSPIKLPVGQTGPIEIVLFLRNNLPKTNVLTWGKIVIDITPNIPAPIVNMNGVPKCYFYYNIPAANCTFDSSTNSSKTIVTIFTPVDFNFQQSQVPLTITTEGFTQPQYQGITIDTLVKRYFFEIQFYSHLRPPPIPLEVIFDEWIPDSIGISSLSCTSYSRNINQYDHLKCSFTTPNQVLNDAGHIHFFRIEFGSSSSYNGWLGASNTITPDYPCLMYGTNVSANPYVKCDYYTWQSGPHKSSLLTTSFNYITFYGLDTIPGGSLITFEIPKMQRDGSSGYHGYLKFSILEDTPGYTSPIVYIYTQTIHAGSNTGGGSYPYTSETPTIVLTNSIINKVTDITLSNYTLGTTNPTTVIFEVDTTAFPNIGRGQAITCGAHTCSKFDSPIQYFILYPSSNLGTSSDLTFPAIATPPYSGDFLFHTRVYLNSNTEKKGQFSVTVDPEPIVQSSYDFHTNQTITQLYPNADHYFNITWTTVNPLLTTSGPAHINISINNVFTLSSTHCEVITTVTPHDGRGVLCELTKGGTVIDIKNLGDVPAGSVFNLFVQLISTETAATVSPTVTIKTYYGNDALVDQAVNVPFATTPLTNSNLVVLTSFSLPETTTSKRAITAGYFGPLLVNFDPVDSSTVINGSKIILTMPSQFRPATNSLGLPLSCILNSKRFPCTYSINPFVITITQTQTQFTTGVNLLNITTEYQNMNGIFFPTTQGRYRLEIQIRNDTDQAVEERVQQYVDILPPQVDYFNISWAHRDIGIHNIFQIQFKNGPNAIPSYSDGANAGRILIGFPIVDENGGSVFDADLGFTTLNEGNILPCYFQTGSGFAAPTPGNTLECKLRKSNTNNYKVWVEIVNFNTIAANQKMRIFFAKVKNPSIKQIDVDFILKINTVAVTTNIESQLYYTKYNMFFNMLTKSITNRNELDPNSVFFQPGASVGKTNQYFNITPYTGWTFAQHDWWIIDMDANFPLSGNIYSCNQPYYQYCIIYPTINWLAVKVGNGTIISLQPFVSKWPISISRVDTTFKTYTFRSGRWSETITHTLTRNYRWLQLRGAISAFSFEVVGSQNKLNVGQKNVQVLVRFRTEHMVPKGGSIMIQFPNNATTVPAIKQHCRSAVTMGSTLYGYDTGKPAVNVQGEVGCVVQNTYSWIITGFAELPANSQVIIFGWIDFPTVPVNTLGMGYVATYENQDSSNTFTTARTIDYLFINFPLQVQNQTWSLDHSLTQLSTAPLRVNHVGQFKFFINFDSTFQCYNMGAGNSGEIYINFNRRSITGSSGGFPAPPSNLICTIVNPSTGLKYGCKVNYYYGNSVYYGYQILTYQNLPANTVLQFVITTLHGSGTEGIPFPTSVGQYKTELQINYCDSCSNNKAQAHYVEVYGSDWTTLEFNSTVTIPNQNNFVLVTLRPSSSISTSQQIVIEIPTVALDGQALYPPDLGMGYKPYDALIFDMYQSSITMECRVYPGDASDKQPTKIVCSKFSSTVSTSTTIKFGFWMVNPQVSKGMAIPIQIYAYDQPTARKYVWSILEAGIRLLPITATPITDVGNFYSSSTYREIQSQDFDFTTRNTKTLVRYDWYILKFNFDLRQSANTNNQFKYNSGFGASGDVIFMRNCQTVMLRVQTTDLTFVAPASSSRNAKINNLFYNPPWQLTQTQATIKAYAVYNSLDECERVYYSDLFPSLNPREISSQTFNINSYYTTEQKGMVDDWQFQLRMSSSGTNSTSMVKFISIEVPNTTTSDVQFTGRQCVERTDSEFELKSCVIDITNRMIWITPVIKSSYNDADYLRIQTQGLAIRSPQTNAANKNMFIVRYYTWPDSMTKPTIVRGSNDWCFLRMDSTYIGSSVISNTRHTATNYPQHTFLGHAEEIIVNEWEPAHYFIGNSSHSDYLKKSPFEFKMIAPSTFNSYTGSNYHYVQVDFGSYYTHPTINQRSADLYYYVPQCLLNGKSILRCTISSNKIKMEFQQSIANGQRFSVKLTIINPKSQVDEGFLLPNTNNPSLTLPVYLYNRNQNVKYLVKPTPFHTYYRASSNSATYPSYGISSVSIQYGTQVAGKLNYLEFTVTLTRTDVNGFVIQIPVVAKDGNKIYNNPTLMGLQSGSQYPCSRGIYKTIYCYYQQGNSNGFGQPTRIYVTGFGSSLSSTTFNFKMLFTNPDINNVFPSFTWKAFGGSFSTPDLMGKELKGYHEVINPYKVYTTVGYTSTGTLSCYPTKALWQKGGYYDCYTSQQSLGSNNYVIMKWKLVDNTYGSYGDYTYTSSYTYDHFFMNEGQNEQYVYIVKKYPSGWTAGTSGSSSYAKYGGITSYHRFGQLRYKHLRVNSYKMYLLKKPSFKEYTASVSVSFSQSYKVENYFGTWSLDAMDTQVKINGWNGWQFVSLNAGNVMSSYSYSNEDPSQKVVEVQFYANKPYSSLSSTTTNCVLESGLIGNDPLNPITCYLDRANNRILFRNVFWFTSTQLKFYYYATTNSDSTNFQTRVWVWANEHAYSDRSWRMYLSYTSNSWTYQSMTYATNTGYNSLHGSERPFGNNVMDISGYGSTRILNGHNVRTEGYSQITYVSSSQIKVKLYASVSKSFYKVFRMGFRFYTPRLKTTTCSSVSVWTSRWGWNNFNGNAYSPGSFGVYCGNAGSNSRRFYAIFDMYYTTSSSRYPYQWPNYSNGDTYEFTFNFNTVSGHHNNYPGYLWVSASMQWQESYWYYRSSTCGCCSSYCCRTCCCNSYDNSYCCSTCCSRYCNCRRIKGYSYYTFTGTQSKGYYQSPGAFADSAGINLSSRNYGQEAEFVFHLHSINQKLTSTMNSLSYENNAELIIELKGNTNYPSNNPFPYTSNSESSAYIDCLCKVSSSQTSLSPTLTWSPANCTRHIVSGMNPFITVRVNANVGQWLYCGIPGLKLPPSSGGSSWYARFFWNPIHTARYHSIPYHHYSKSWSTSSQTLYLTSSSITSMRGESTESSYFWQSSGGGQVLQSMRYYLYLRQHAYKTNPVVYYSGYYPKPPTSICSSTSSYTGHCRVYRSFNQRRYFIIAQRSGSVYTMTWDTTAQFPQSKDYATSFYDVYVGWTIGGWDRYYSKRTWTVSKSKLREATPYIGIAVPVYGNNLRSYSTPFTFKVNLNGYTLYSNQRTVGPFRGSFIKITTGSFSTLYGCGAHPYYQNQRAFFNNALYCRVISNTVMKIWSNSDLTFTGYLVVTFSTGSNPSSSTITFELYDKYISSSDYARSVYVTTSFSNNPSGVTILPPTNIDWHRMTYKQLRTDAGPLRVVVRNNYEYVTAYNTSSNSVSTSTSNGIIFRTHNTQSSNQAFKCVVREYLPTQYHLYTEYNLPCQDYSTTQVHLRSRPDHIMKPEFFYEFIIYQNKGSGSPFLTTMSTNSIRKIQTWSGVGSPGSWSTKYYDVNGVNKYKSTNAFSLHSIYILSRQAAVQNSLYIDFTINVAASSVYFLELEFDALDLQYFNIQHGDQIPCYLSGLSSASGIQDGPVCFGYSTGTNNTSPLIVRVVNFASFSSKNMKLALDNFNNPPSQLLFAVPINIRMRLKELNSKYVYTSFFPQVYYSDSINIRTTVINTGSLTKSNSYLGNSNYHYWAVGWPYSSGSNVHDKIALKIEGGVTCCSPYSSLDHLTDQYHTYSVLWANTKANTTIYQMPSRSSGTSTTFRINNVVNPNPVDFATYEQGKKITLKWYSVYKTYNIYTLNQPNYSSYSKKSDFQVDNSANYVADTKPNHFNSHQNYPLTYQFYHNIGANSYNGRNISYIIVYFTSGVKSLDSAWMRYYSSVINKVGSVKIGVDPSNNQWYYNVTGVQDSHFSASNHWYVRVRLFANNNNRIYYTSYVYNYNGQLEFATTSGNFHPSSSGGFSSSSNYGTPNMWELQHQRYTRGYYELERKTLYAKSGQTTNKLFFKFTTPYNISQVETITLVSSSPSFPASATPNNGIFCLIQPTQTQYVKYGAGYYAPCGYGSGTFTVHAPTGGLVEHTQYLLTVIDRIQKSSTFNMPTSPMRLEISLIFNSILNIAYGDVFTLDFAAHMTTYAVSHSHLMSSYYDMLGFTFRPAFNLASASTSSPVTESILSFEVESKYYDICLGIASVFSPDNMPFYSGVEYSHWAQTAVANANTRIKCGKDVQAQNWAPAILSMTDYGALSSSSTYYFRFPLITLPSGTNVPLTYKVRLLEYANNVPYPTVISQYKYQAKQFATGATHNSNQWASLSLSNNQVQKTMSVSFSYSNSGGNIGNGAETIVKFDNNDIPALTSLATLTSLTNSNFAYEYYPNINLALFRYTGGGTTRSFSLGTYPTSNDQQTFKLSFVQTFSGTSRKKGWFNSGTNLAIYTVNAANSWTSTTFTKGSNLIGTNSWDMYTVTWSANYLTFPQGSRMLITFNNRLDLLDQYCYKHSGFLPGADPNSNLVCKRYSSNQIMVSGYASLATSATLSITVWASLQNGLLNGTNYTADATVRVISSGDNNIVSANTDPVSLTMSPVKGCNSLGLSGTMTNPYAKGSSFPLYVSFQLKTYTLVNGDSLQIDFGNWVLDTATTGVQVFKYQVAGSIYWVPSSATVVSGNRFKIPVYENYSMNAGSVITIWVDTFAPDTYYGARIPNTQWNDLKIFAYKGSTLREQKVHRVWTEPFHHASFAVSSVLKYAGASTLYEFSVTPNVSATAGDTLLLQFTTGQLLQNRLFSDTLGATIPQPNPGSFDCNQYYNTNVLSDSGINCNVFKGDNTTSPSTPTTIAIKIKKNVAANTLIKFNILGITNPTVMNYPIGVVLKLANTCSQSDSNNLCDYYKSVTYMTFTASQHYVGTGTTGSLSFNPNLVSYTNTVHTVSAGYSVSAGDWVRVKYYPEVPIPTTCNLVSSNGECYSYPTQNIIMIRAASSQSSYSFQLGGMTNPYQQYYGTNTFYSEVWRGTAGTIAYKFYTSYQAQYITTDPISSNPLNITFTPTLTPDYQLKYSFNNIARIQVTHLLQNKNIQMIYMWTGSEVRLDTSYCNATMETYYNQAKPYPFRFICTSMGNTWLKLNMQSDFPAWTSNHTGRSIFLYLRYTISNGQTNFGNYWYAEGYTHATSTTWYYRVSRANGRFAIVEYLLPYLYVISLWTKSFVQRTCTINQQCMFYGFLLPSTDVNDIKITYMTFILPREFKYSPARTLNRCTLQPTTTSLWTFNCDVTRSSAQITIKYSPYSNTYNQWYNLINIDHSDASKLFTAPAYPGNHYQMGVNLWSASHQLVESQNINITTVYGHYLSVPNITFDIPHDADQKGMYQLTFLVGSSDILPAYQNSASNSITSSIEISFANTFAPDLGTGLAAGSEIACLNITGLTFNTMGRIKCQIYPSVSTITFPTIIVTGYDRIQQGSTVSIQFADLQTLPAGITDFCKLGVALTYFKYGGTKGYIYEPVSFVVGPTTAANPVKAITFSVSETGSHIVGQFTDYAFQGTIGAGFAPVTTSDYLVVQFPRYTFEGRFHLNAQALCSLATANKCSVFGLAAQIYIQPASTISASAFSFTIQKLINAAFAIPYVDKTVKIFTVVGRKVDAVGTSSFLKFTQRSSNITARIIHISSIYGGDSATYTFGFQLNSYLPQNGKISLFFPWVFPNLFSTNSSCYLDSISKKYAGVDTYCKIINYYQLVVVPNGVLLSKNIEYKLVVTNISNPNSDISNYHFDIKSYYFTSVYKPSVITGNTFSPKALSVRTVKDCQLQANLSIYNPGLPADYSLNLMCPSPISQASHLKVYLDWNPATTNGSCSGDASTLYSTQCNIMTEYVGNTKKTFLSIYLRAINTQTVIAISAGVTNGNQGTYTLNATIGTDALVQFKATSNSFYINSGSTSTSSASATQVTRSSTGTIITSAGQAISIKSANFPSNRLQKSIYTFSITKPSFVVANLEIKLPALIKASADGINCGYQTYRKVDDYFNLMVKQGSNPLICKLNSDKIILTGIDTVLNTLKATDFLYLTIEGLLNPDTSLSQSNFTFTFINTTSTFAQAILRFQLPLSYTISDPPADIQIEAITLSNPKYYATSTYTFMLNALTGASFSITQQSHLGVMIHFPQEYGSIWNQIPAPSQLSLIINNQSYNSTSIRMANRYLFAVFPTTLFPTQLDFTTFNITFVFRNPNETINCQVNPVFTVSLFDFKGNSIYAQTLSNNQICPNLTTHLFDIKVTGNTKISAGSSSTFYITLQKPARNMTITPACQSSAISFKPSSINFTQYKQTNQTFRVIAANGLSGSFNVTFGKQENGNHIFYADIQYLTLNIYAPTSKYWIKVKRFVRKSVGRAIKVRIQLQVPSPTQFALLATTNCNSAFVFSPAQRIEIPADTTLVNYTVTYTGTTIPSACSQTFSISSITANNYQLTNPTVYYSAKISIDKTAVQHPMLLRLSNQPIDSVDVGKSIITNTSTQTTQYKPTVYSLQKIAFGSNSINFTVTTSYIGTVHYAIVQGGTPNSKINQTEIYHKNLSVGVVYGEVTAQKNTQGVNIQSNFLVTGLNAQTKYKIAIYLNSTVGNSDMLFLSFKTNKASNAAAIKLAMDSTLGVGNSTTQAAFITALSQVLQVLASRIYILTSNATLQQKQNSYKSNVMKQRKYIYQVLIAPNKEDDSIPPKTLLKNFKADTNAKNTLKQFVPEYILSFPSPVRQVFNIIPKKRSNQIFVDVLTYETVEVRLSFWSKAFVYAVILQNSSANLTSQQIINGLDQNNTAVIPQHYKNITSNRKGLVSITFALLKDKTNYTVYISAESPMPYPPRLALEDAQVLTKHITTKENTNLMKNAETAVEAIRQEDAALADEVSKVQKKNKNQNALRGIDKTKKTRQRS